MAVLSIVVIVGVELLLSQRLQLVLGYTRLRQRYILFQFHWLR